MTSPFYAAADAASVLIGKLLATVTDGVQVPLSDVQQQQLAPALRALPLTALPKGCAFAPRCRMASEKCKAEYPAYEEKKPGHWAACWHSDQVAGGKNG
mgnify:CR=1 FL=1